MKLYLVRHGQTVENVNHIHQGHTDGQLTELGQEQALRIAERLRKESFDVIYASDLGRAANTARAIAKFHKGTPMHFARELRERDMGGHEGIPWDDEWDWDDLPENVEPNDSMMRRAKGLLDRVYDEYPEGNILFVSHGGLLNALLAAIEKDEMNEQRFIPLENTSITILDLREGGDHEIHLLNCVEHLEPIETL